MIEEERREIVLRLERFYKDLTAIKRDGTVVIPHRYKDGQMGLTEPGNNKKSGKKDVLTVAEVLVGLSSGKYNLRMSVLGKPGLPGDTPSIRQYKAIRFRGEPLTEFFSEERRTVTIGVDNSEHFLPHNGLLEGDKETSSRFRRNALARVLCLEHHGYSCKVCGIRMLSIYGLPLEDDFIHVHHLKPFVKGEVQREVVPARDLIPVCPNCHAMLHKSPDPLIPYTPEQLRNFMAKSNVEMVFRNRANSKP